MRRKATWILCALALGVVAFGVTGCGGGEKEAVTETVTVSSDTTTEETTTDAETTTEEETTTDETETETETSDTDTDTTPDLSFISNENCREFVQFASQFSQALSGTGDTDVQEAADTMQEFADQAPEEIRDDFQTLADAYSKIADALDGADLSSGQTPDAGTIAKLAQLSQEIDSTKLSEASQNISDWTQNNCTNG